MSKLITVFGATGNQGGSVIKHILADPTLSSEFKVRGITRDVSKPAAKALSDQGVEMKTADLSSKSSLKEAISGSHTVFLVTNFWETMKKDVEVSQGKNVADVAKEAGVSHLIFSSLLNVAQITEGRLKDVPHFDGKAEVEDYIRASGVPATFILPGYFMTNYQGNIKKGDDGSYTLTYPIGFESKAPLIDISDTGKFVNGILKKRDGVLGARILVSEDYYTPKRLLKELEEVTGKKTNFVQVTAEQFKGVLPQAIAQELLETHLFIENPGYYNGESLDASHKIVDGKLTSWKDFIVKSGAFN